MTEHDAKGLEIIAGWLQRDGLIEPAAMLRRLAAGASEGQAEPIYQVKRVHGWVDVPESRYTEIKEDPNDCGELRILYLHPSAEIAALRERIAGMAKDARPRHWNAVYNTDAMQRACDELPEFWEIQISLERDGGCVELRDPNGDEVEFDEDADQFDWKIHQAIDAAIAKEKQQ